MRVLFLNDPPLIKYGLAPGFRQAGQKTSVMHGQASQMWGHPAEEQVRRLTAAIDRFRPDLIFNEGYQGCNIAGIAETARQKGIPSFFWAIEDPLKTEWLSTAYARHADHVFTTAVETLPTYARMGKPASVLLFGCNPSFHRPVPPRREYMHDVVLVANYYRHRAGTIQWFLLPLLEAGYDVRVWGHGWLDPGEPGNLLAHKERCGGGLPYEYLPAVYNSAKVALCVNSVDSSLVQTSMRPYEILACAGAIAVGHHTPAQRLLFGDLMFHPADPEQTRLAVDTVLRMSYYDRAQLAGRARNHVWRRHNYAKRAGVVIDAFEQLTGAKVERKEYRP